MSWKNFLRRNAVYNDLPSLYALRKIPEVKVDQHAANFCIFTAVLYIGRTDHYISHGLDCQNACRTNAELFSATRREQCLVLELCDERGRIDEDAKMVENLRDTVVCEHCELMYSFWEEGM